MITPTYKHWNLGNKIPGPKPLPIVGNGLTFARKRNILNLLIELYRKYGSVYRLWLGKQLFVVISNPKDMEFFLSRPENLSKSASYKMLEPLFGKTGLIISDADIWRVHRKQINPSFHSKLVEKSVPVILENGQILIEQLKKKIDHPDFDIRNFVEKCTLDILSGAKNQLPFLDLLLKKSNFTEEEIEDEVLTIMFAGQDAPSTTVSFCLYELSRNQKVQDKLFEELKNSSIHEKSEPTFHDYTKLKYLEMVIKETLRMYPPATIIGRKVDEDIRLPSGYVLPANSLANLFVFNMQRDEKYFSNPDQFIPERFENIENINSFTYLPFSAGIRNCIGRVIVNLKIKSVSTKIWYIRSKSIVIDDSIKISFITPTQIEKLTLEFGVVLFTSDPISLRITSRKILYKIPRSTLQDYIKALSANNEDESLSFNSSSIEDLKKNQVGRKTVLSEKVKKVLVDLLEICTKWEFPLKLADIRKTVRDYLISILR
ncbi:hypothetical protein PGB90_002206 [Kerria lacca]